MNKQYKSAQKRGIEWKPIVGFEGLYEVSNQGQVYSFLRKTTHGGILAPVLNTSGYFRVSLTKDGKHRYLYIHHLVAQAFIGERPSGLDINHIDGNKLNNQASNLEYCTRTENMAHARRLGLHDNRGSKQWNAKFTEAEVFLIRVADSGCGILDEILSIPGIQRRTIMDIIERKTWRHVP